MIWSRSILDGGISLEKSVWIKFSAVMCYARNDEMYQKTPLCLVTNCVCNCCLSNRVKVWRCPW